MVRLGPGHVVQGCGGGSDLEGLGGVNAGCRPEPRSDRRLHARFLDSECICKDKERPNVIMIWTYNTSSSNA